MKWRRVEEGGGGGAGAGAGAGGGGISGGSRLCGISQEIGWRRFEM